MRNNPLIAVALLACGLAACKGGSEALIDRLDGNAAHRRADEVRGGAACAKLVTLELGRSLPVPQRGARLAVLFYPAKSEPGKSSVLSPAAKAEFSLDGAAADRCEALAGAGARSLGPAVPEGLSQEAYYRAQLAVYEALPAVAAQYARGGAPDAEGLKSLKAFAGGFLAVAEPGLRADYYRLNPEFWEWVRGQAGESLPKP